MNLYTQMIGGIGDLLLYMMKPGSPLGYFPALKARGDTTMIVAHANTDAAAELFDNLPAVDYVSFRGYSKRFDTSGGALKFNLLKDYRGMPWAQPSLTLDAEEQKILGDLKREPYIAVHITASLPEKVPPNFTRLLDNLRDTRLRIVLLGCETDDSARPDPGRRSAGIDSKTGGFVVLPPRLRLHVAAAQNAAKFIGTLSCFNCAAQLAKVPSFVIVNRSLQEPNVYGMMARNGAIVRPWNAGQSVDRIYREATEWIK